ncbi:MAG: hypothetical protein GQ474_04705 [Sulfurimonas sp.]|nr:hypothetical protein [Sulfurimonas sp.]
MNFIKLIIIFFFISTAAFGVMTNKEKLVCIQMHTINFALEMFKIDNNVFPTTDEGLDSLLNNPNKEKYPNYFQEGYLGMQQIPKDIWHNSFHYKLSRDKVNITSSGTDGVIGNSDDIHFPSCISE